MTKAEDGLRRFIFEVVTELFYSPEFVPGAEEKVDLIKDFLEENPQYNFVLYFNHISFNDPAIVINVVDKIDPSFKKHLVTMMSYSHTDPTDPKHKVFAFMAKGLEKCGVEGIRVIQKYQVNNPDFGYTEEQANLNYMQSMRRLKELRGTPTGVIISPEGTRSNTGTMAKGESGVVAIGRILAPIIYIPLAISYEGKYKRNTINIGKKMKMNIGDVVIQESSKDYPSVDLLMTNLSLALPEEMRGVWR